jgi:peptidoglycan/LPS O-acetylase OafA/YrhL
VNIAGIFFYLKAKVALWVFLYHAWVMAGPRLIKIPLGIIELDLTPFFSIGWAGVPIFFVLSGFLLGLPFAEWQAGVRERPELGRYLFRRVMRVFPAYYVQILVLLIIAYGIHGQSPIGSWLDAIRHAAMLFVPPPVGMTPVNPVWWTLPIEFSFYLLLPFLAYLLRPHYWWRLLAVCMVAMWLWRYGVVMWMTDRPVPEKLVAAYQLPGSLDTFGLGMLGALLYVNRACIPAWVLPRHETTRMALLGLTLSVAAIYWMHAGYREYWSDSLIFYTWTPLFGLGLVSIILSAMLGCRLVQVLFGNRYLVFVGVISYSLYLWHAIVLSWVLETGVCGDGEGYCLPRLLGMVAPVVLAIASLSYVFVERPFMHWRRRSGPQVDEQKPV